VGGSNKKLQSESIKVSLAMRNMNSELFHNSLQMSFIKIPAGSFYMGSNESEHSLANDFAEYGIGRLAEFADEAPIHKVMISTSFWLGQYSVTVEQFGNFVTHSGYVPESIRDGLGGYGFTPVNAKSKMDTEEVFNSRNPQYSWIQTGYAQGDDHPVVNVTWNDANAMAGSVNVRAENIACLPRLSGNTPVGREPKPVTLREIIPAP
jgi:formylglycine-generating enzyme required for sulfatase activity